jgi:acetolactate decarboxylase
MKNSIALIFCVLLLSFAGCQSVPKNKDALYQVSTLPALAAGVYDGTVEAEELNRRGDIGIGTFQSLDGELVMADGIIYQVKADGRVVRPNGRVKIPFACVTFFERDLGCPLSEDLTYAQFKEKADRSLKSKNLPYAVRLEGVFKKVVVRSVPAQKRPYPPLAEIVKNQPVFERTEVTGSMVGFRMPEYFNGINTPGYHLHFLSKDRKFGGHVLDFVVDQAEFYADLTAELKLTLPTSEEFSRIDLLKANEGVQKAEK